MIVVGGLNLKEDCVVSRLPLFGDTTQWYNKGKIVRSSKGTPNFITTGIILKRYSFTFSFLTEDEANTLYDALKNNLGKIMNITIGEYFPITYEGIVISQPSIVQIGIENFNIAFELEEYNED